MFGFGKPVLGSGHSCFQLKQTFTMEKIPFWTISVIGKKPMSKNKYLLNTEHRWLFNSGLLLNNAFGKYFLLVT